MMKQRRKPTFFQVLCIGISLIVVLVLVAVFLGLILFSSPEALLGSLLSEEIWYAIKLSVITAVIYTILSGNRDSGCVFHGKIRIFRETVGKRPLESSPLSPAFSGRCGTVDLSLSCNIADRAVSESDGGLCRLYARGNNYCSDFCQCAVHG